MLILGIFLGLGSALASSLAYLASRRFTVRQAGHEPGAPRWRGPLRLMVCAHVMLSVVCGSAYLVLVPRGGSAALADARWAVTTTVFVAVFYLTGNTLLFFALRRAEASRVSTLLGMKVVLLAIATHFILQQPLAGQQWVAVVLATSAAWVLGASGQRLPLSTMAIAVGSCAGFVCSDLFIDRMYRAWLPAGLTYEQALKAGGPLVRASITGMSLVYVWCGLIALAMLPLAKPWRREYWLGSAPYAASWMTAMLCLFSAFALVGIVLGNILQSTRGLVSIVLGVVVVKLGHHHIETHAPLRVVVQRAIAAAMMIGAIVLFVTA